MASSDSDFTALILLSSVDRPGIEEGLAEVLSPFSLKVLETQKIALRGRLILGTLIACDPAHVLAIEEDLLKFGSEQELDIAIDYSESQGS